MSKDVYRAYGRSYVRFGVLKDFSTDGDRITIVNEQNETRIKSKVYSSWTTTADKLKDMIGQDIITSTTAQTPSYANSVFSDVFINRNIRSIYMVTMVNARNRSLPTCCRCHESRTKSVLKFTKLLMS